jgi:dTDP-4-dehydrorhamnose reductase
MDNQKSLQEEKNTKNSHVLITGGHGLLGKKLNELFENSLTPSHQEMDIRQNLMNSDYIKNIKNEIHTVIHCAALKNEICTKKPSEALLTNIVGTANVALFCQEIGAKLVYISTDYVFKGDRGNYKTTDEVGPVNYYAETKLAGEYATKSVKNHLIIRLSFFPDIFPYEKAFLDQFSTRMTASEAAIRIKNLIDQNQQGIKHLAGLKQSVYDFAQSTANGKYIKPIYLHEDELVRPKDTSLEEI